MMATFTLVEELDGIEGHQVIDVYLRNIKTKFPNESFDFLYEGKSYSDTKYFRCNEDESVGFSIYSRNGSSRIRTVNHSNDAMTEAFVNFLGE